ncbi:MAG: cellulase family glycosylhydrolase [Candidatus Omnitrophica bacterium]|nr:cellulase family glycosylhydrolase [Candidatus Omnitrophota bacterium]MDD5351776.1 cellulase family glycosylhydrolase [Candidatus Omnitrophota bacterium]MDD5550602.1 cellulase family glycosylhydrolase [Candidatus Omnitrophota bacterium]
MKREINWILVVLFFMVSQIPVYGELDNETNLPKVSYKNNSREWHARNDYLIPGDKETEVILSLNQKRDFNSNDIDADGVVNSVDPSMYDWREIGYQPFGVLEFLSWRHEWNNYKYSEDDLKKVADLLSEAGVTFVRMDFLWQDIEPQKDNFDFAKYDFIVDLLSKKNIRILGVLGYCASWAGDDWNYIPRNLEDFTGYVSSVVSRYKDSIKYWEIWNEPDSTIYWKTQDAMQTYTNLLKESFLAAKKVDPSCRIVLGGMTSEGFYAIKNVYRNGGKDYFDIINIHPFVNPLDAAQMQRVYAIYNNLERLKLQYNDKDKKIWFTEIGCPGIGPGIETKGWWIGKSPSEEGQAKFLYYIYTDLIDLPNVEKIFWAYFRDNKDHFKNDVDYFGLIRWDFSKKPAFIVFQRRCQRWINLHNYLQLNKKYGR